MHDASLEGTTFHACPTEKLEKGGFRETCAMPLTLVVVWVVDVWKSE
jgi:hypothetical protein